MTAQVLVTVDRPASGPVAAERRPLFEHRILKFAWGWKGFDYAAMETEINELGAQGWEAVGTIVPSVGAGQSTEIAIVLKRTRD